MSRLFLFLLLFLVGAACNINNSKSDVLNEIKDARKTWSSSNPQNYSFHYQTLCFCALTDEVRIVVQADTIADVQDIETNETIMVAVSGTEIIAPIYDFYPSSFFTINEFFERLEVQIPVADESNVAFDKSTGMPVEIYFDFIEEAIDDEITYLFSNLIIN